MSIVTDERKDLKGRKLRTGESYDEKIWSIQAYLHKSCDMYVHLFTLDIN